MFVNSTELQEVFDAKYNTPAFQLAALLLTSPVAFMKGGGMFSAYTQPLWGKDYMSKKTYGYMNLDEVLEKATLPPTYLITSDGDALAHDATIKAYELLQEKGIQSEMKNYGNDENGKALPHVFSVLEPFNSSGQEAIDGALAFYQDVIQ